jgi:hypothetical protein
MDPRLLLLDPRDNVVVVRAPVAQGVAVQIDNAMLTVAVDVPIGHKLARRSIATGDKVLKYGAPIGVATADIVAGAHVHVHNVRSDYTPSYILPKEADSL